MKRSKNSQKQRAVQFTEHSDCNDYSTLNRQFDYVFIHQQQMPWNNSKAFMTDLSVQDGKPQYLMLARKSPYKTLAEQFAIYSDLEKLANNEKNQVILTP